MSILGDRNEDVGVSTPSSLVIGRAASSPSPSPFEAPPSPSAMPVPSSTSALADTGTLTATQLDWAAADTTFGPIVFERRRQLWICGQPPDKASPVSAAVTSGLDSTIGGKGSKGNYGLPKRSNPSAEALKRLDDVLASPHADTNDDLWQSYLSDVHRRLVGGNRLKKGFKLSQAVSKRFEYIFCVVLLVSREACILCSVFLASTPASTAFFFGP